jgi:hypothetical protein
VVAAITLLLARLPADQLITIVPDDAYFYLKTAWHVASGHGSTFDGLNATNGYHPLYLGVLAVLSAIVPLQGLDGLRAVLWLDAACTIAWFGVMALVARRLGWTRWETWALMGLLLPLAAIGETGMEVNLLLPLAWGFVALSAGPGLTPAREWQAGAVGALACLARLDSIAFVGLVALGSASARYGWPWPSWRPPIAALVRLVGPSVLALGGFAVWNAVVFGHPSTVSSWLKAGAQPELAAIGGALDLSPQTLVLLLTAVTSAAAVLRAVQTRRAADLPLAALGLWAAIYVVAMTVLLRGGLEAWYYPLPVSAAVVAGVGVMRGLLARDARPLNAVLLAGALLGVVAAGLALRIQLGRGWYFADGLAMGRWIDDRLPAPARVFQVDNSGIVAYFAERAVINGDGLINGWDYQRALRAGRLPEYLASLNVEYLVFDEADATTAPEVAVPLWNAPAVTLWFERPPEELARFGRFVLWRIDPRMARVTRPGEAAPHGVR